MGIETMGQVVVKAKIENLKDLLDVEAGQLTPDKVRALEVDNAVVDTGARLLALPTSMIKQLGLQFFRTRTATTAAGNAPCNIYRSVSLSIQDRQCTVDVAEVPDTCPVLIGYYPLELLDFVVDPKKQQLVGRHGDEDILDLY